MATAISPINTEIRMVFIRVLLISSYILSKEIPTLRLPDFINSEEKGIDTLYTFSPSPVSEMRPTVADVIASILFYPL